MVIVVYIFDFLVWATARIMNSEKENFQEAKCWLRINKYVIIDWKMKLGAFRLEKLKI